MLTHISIKDFAIIDSISLDFHEGLHVLTGETGAGKSIIVEAINMGLGGRADTSFVRTGKDKAVIELSVETNNPAVLSMLSENGLDCDGTIYITREIMAGGKSLSRINGTLVSLSFLNNLCKNIADIHGQYDHQSLLDSDTHILLLDSYGIKQIGPLRSSVENIYEKYQSLLKEINSINSLQEENIRNKDLMQYQLTEISQSNPLIGEDLSLAEQLTILKNSEFLQMSLSDAYNLLYEQSPSSQDGLAKAMGSLEGIKKFSKEYTDLADALSECFYKLEDLQIDLRKAKESIVYSPEIIDETIERISLLDRLKKKYGGTIDEILAYKEKIQSKLSEIESDDTRLLSLTDELAICQSQLQSACQNLSDTRRSVAAKMEKHMEKELNELNFNDTRLIVDFSSLLNDNPPKYTSSGFDSVEFLIITNKGEDPKPLIKIASGGEISRIMLAFKTILGDFDTIPTLIFDEIDSGISGITASIVGKKMREIAKGHQILCITHLPQIAAFSQHHYKIYKDEAEGRTVSSVKPLSSQEKVQEVARLLGGLHLTETVIKNAEELINQCTK